MVVCHNKNVPDNVSLAQLMAQSMGGGGMLNKSPKELLPHFQQFESKLMTRIKNGELDNLFQQMGEGTPTKTVGVDKEPSFIQQAAQVMGFPPEEEPTQDSITPVQATKTPGLRSPRSRKAKPQVNEQGIILNREANLFERVSERYQNTRVTR